METPQSPNSKPGKKINWYQWAAGAMVPVMLFAVTNLVINRRLKQEPGDGYRTIAENQTAKDQLIEKAKRYMRQGNYHEAIKVLEVCLSSFGESGEVRLLVAQAHQMSDDYTKAEDNFLHAIKMDPQNAEYYGATVDFYFDWIAKTNDSSLVIKLNDLWKGYRSCKFCESSRDCTRPLDDIPISPPIGKTHIISIGIDRYSAGSRAPLQQLYFAEHDAEMVARAFRVSNFLGRKGSEVVLRGKNATKTDIIRSIKEISDLAVDDRLVIYFAGHGFYRNGKRFIVPYDARPGDRSSVISLSELSKVCATLNLKQKPIVIMDACSEEIGYFDPVSGKNQYDPSILISGDDNNLILLSGTSVGEKSLETKVLSGGLFTRALISSIADLSRDGNVQNSSLLDLYRRTDDKMSYFNREFSVDQNIDFKGCY